MTRWDHHCVRRSTSCLCCFRTRRHILHERERRPLLCLDRCQSTCQPETGVRVAGRRQGNCYWPWLICSWFWTCWVCSRLGWWPGVFQIAYSDLRQATWRSCRTPMASPLLKRIFCRQSGTCVQTNQPDGYGHLLHQGWAETRWASGWTMKCGQLGTGIDGSPGSGDERFGSGSPWVRYCMALTSLKEAAWYFFKKKNN